MVRRCENPTDGQILATLGWTVVDTAQPSSRNLRQRREGLDPEAFRRRVRCGMTWVRSNIKCISRIALFALVIQFALSFGHFHASAATSAPEFGSALSEPFFARSLPAALLPRSRTLSLRGSLHQITTRTSTRATFVPSASSWRWPTRHCLRRRRRCRCRKSSHSPI